MSGSLKLIVCVCLVAILFLFEYTECSCDAQKLGACQNLGQGAETEKDCKLMAKIIDCFEDSGCASEDTVKGIFKEMKKAYSKTCGASSITAGFWTIGLLLVAIFYSRG